MSDSLSEGEHFLHENDSWENHALEGLRPHDDLAAEEPVPENSPPQGNRVLQVGVVFVIGAVAANVFGFRQSRWAVGKDLHRAWERSNAHRNTKQARQAQQDRQAASKWRENMSGRDRSSGFRRAQRHSSNRMFDEFVRQAEAHAHDNAWNREAPHRASRYGGSDDDGAHDSSKSRDARSSSTRFKVTFESDTIDEILRNLRQEGPNFRATPSPKRFSYDDFPDLAELLRAAQKAQTDGNVGGRDQRDADTDFDAEFWNAVFGTDGKTRHGSHTHNRTSSQQRPFTGRDSSLSSAYGRLGLREGASKDEVKAAYRRQAIKFHPDTYAGSDPADAASKFREVTAAYRQLKEIG